MPCCFVTSTPSKDTKSLVKPCQEPSFYSESYSAQLLGGIGHLCTNWTLLLAGGLVGAEGPSQNGSESSDESQHVAWNLRRSSCRSSVVNFLLSCFRLGVFENLEFTFRAHQWFGSFIEGYMPAPFEASVRCPLACLHAVAERTRPEGTQSSTTSITCVPSL